MAIDSATKRRSIMSMAGACMKLMPVADGGFSNFDRAHIAGWYLIAPAAGAVGHYYRLLVRSRRHR